jgi:GT2 family glycosyltransferase
MHGNNIIPISITLTSYNRLHLLDETISSFYSTNTYAIDEFIIINDSGSIDICKYIQHKYPDVTVICNTENRGLSRSLDTLFNSVKNEYIFHIEEDWLFDKSIPYISQSLTILQNCPHVHQVHVRHQYDTPHKALPEIYTVDNVQYQIMDPEFQNSEWNGYSWNPGLRRKSDYKKMFPQGIANFKDEMQCSKHTRQFNYTAVTLLDTACYHIGGDCSTRPHLYNKHLYE